MDRFEHTSIVIMMLDIIESQTLLYTVPNKNQKFRYISFHLYGNIPI